MAAGEGIITRKEIITDEALAFGTVLAENVQISINKIDELRKLFKDFKSIPKDVKSASNFKDLNTYLEKNITLTNKYLTVLKEQIRLEQTIDRLKKSSIANEKAETKAKIDNANATKAEANARKANALADSAEMNLSKKRQKASEAAAAAEKKRIQQGLDTSSSLYNQKLKEEEQQKRSELAAQRAIQKALEQNRSYIKLQNTWRQAQKALADSIVTDGAKAKSTQRLQREFDVLDKKIKQVDAATKNYSKNVGNYQSAFNGVGNLTSQLAGALGWAGAIAAAVTALKSIYSTTKQLEGLYKAMELGSKTSQDYASNLKFLDKITDDYGLELISTTQAYNKFYLASKNKLSIQEIQLVFDKVSKSASLMGMTVEQQEGTFKALADMMSKGTVMAEELKGQLGDRIPVAVEVMAKALGVGTEELLKMMQNGEVMAADVLPKFAVELEKAVGADQITKVENLTASEVRLKNEWTNFIKEINGSDNAIGDFAMGFLSAVTSMLEGITRLSRSWKSIWDEGRDQSETSGYESAMLNYMDFDKFENQRKKAFQDHQRFLKDEKRLISEIQKETKNYNNEVANKSIFDFTGAAGRDEAKNLEKLNKELGETRGRIKAIKDLYSDWKNPEVASTGGKAETDAQRKKREAAERKAKRDREKNQSNADRAEKERLDKAKKAFEDQINLKIQEADQQADINKRISQDEKSLFENRLSALTAYQEESEKALQLETEKKIKSLSNFSKDYKALTDEEIQTYLKQEGDLTKLKDDQILIFKEYYFQLQKLREENKDDLEKNAEIEAKKIASITAGVLFGTDKDKFEELKAIEQHYKAGLISKEEYEKKLAETSVKFSQLSLQQQIKGLEKLIDITNLSEEEKLKIRAQIAEKSMQLVKELNDYEDEKTKKSIEAQKKKLEIINKYVSQFSKLFSETFDIDSKIVEDFIMNFFDKTKTIEEKIVASFELMKSLSASFYNQRISEMDDEIEKIKEKNDRELENFVGTEKEKERLRIRQNAEEEKLEAKKRREKEKQANVDKAFSIAQTIWATAQAIMQAYGQLGPIGGTIFAAIIGTLGAIQINRIASTKIPKYKGGRKGGKEEMAIVGDGGVHEVVESKEGLAYMTPDTDTLVKLNEGDTVHKSVDDYHKSLQKSMISKMSKDTEKYLDQTRMESLLLEEMKENTRQMRELQRILKSKNMSTTVNVPKIDFEYAAWLAKNR